MISSLAPEIKIGDTVIVNIRSFRPGIRGVVMTLKPRITVKIEGIDFHPIVSLGDITLA